MTWSVSECQRLRFLTYCSFHLRGQCQSFAAHQTGHSQTFNQLTVSLSQCRHPMCIWSAAHPRIKVWVIPLMIRACPFVPFYRPLSEPVYLAACASRRGFIGEPIGWPCEAMAAGRCERRCSLPSLRLSSLSHIRTVKKTPCLGFLCN